MDARQIKTALPGYFTTAEAAQALGYSNGAYIKNLCQQGTVIAYKVANVWLLPVEQVQALAEREGRSTRGQART